MPDRGPYDLAIIGAGSAGFSAAITAAELGARVALVGHGTIGGTCVNTGCIPSKNLIRAMEPLHHAAAATRFGGIRAEARVEYWRAVERSKDALVSSLRQAKLCSTLPGAIAGSAVMVPNTIRCAASGRHSFRRRCRVRSYARLPRKHDLDRRCRRADGGSSSDSPLERAGFEPSVPGESGFGFALRNQMLASGSVQRRAGRNSFPRPGHFREPADNDDCAGRGATCGAHTITRPEYGHRSPRAVRKDHTKDRVPHSSALTPGST